MCGDQMLDLIDEEHNPLPTDGPILLPSQPSRRLGEEEAQGQAFQAASSFSVPWVQSGSHSR